MKFRLKVTMVVISLLSILFAVGGTALINTTFTSAIQREKVIAEKAYSMMFNTITMVNQVKEWNSAEEIAESIRKVTDQEEIFCATRLSSKSAVIYSNGKAAEYMADMRSVSEPQNVICKVIEGADGHYFQQSGCVEIGKEKVYMDTAYDISEIYTLREEQRRTYTYIFVALVFFSAVFSYILAYLLTKPMVRLKEVATKISKGDYEIRSNIKSSDEIGSLSREFDKMTDALVEQMEKQNQFIGNFTHEIKTPMTSIIGYAELLRGGNISQEDQVEAANYIYSEGRRLERLSTKMLELLVAGNETLELTEQQPKFIISRITEGLVEEYKAQGIDLKCQLEPGTCRLEPDLFASLVVNLLENSRRAISDSGVIEVASSMTEEGCVITVSDTGCGIPEESLVHIREAFYRVDKARSRAMGGAGLGLSLCDRIVKLHNGEMDIDSTLGQGTTITIWLKGGRV